MPIKKNKDFFAHINNDDLFKILNNESFPQVDWIGEHKITEEADHPLSKSPALRGDYDHKMIQIYPYVWVQISNYHEEHLYCSVWFNGEAAKQKIRYLPENLRRNTVVQPYVRLKKDRVLLKNILRHALLWSPTDEETEDHYQAERFRARINLQTNLLISTFHEALNGVWGLRNPRGRMLITGREVKRFIIADEGIELLSIELPNYVDCKSVSTQTLLECLNLDLKRVYEDCFATVVKNKS